MDGSCNNITFFVSFWTPPLATPVQFSKIISPICLPSGDKRSYLGRMATVAGWGLTASNIQASRLQEVDLQTLNQCPFGIYSKYKHFHSIFHGCYCFYSKGYPFQENHLCKNSWQISMYGRLWRTLHGQGEKWVEIIAILVSYI